MIRVALTTIGFALAACSKPGDAVSTDAAPRPAPVASASAAASAPPSSAAPRASVSWAGSYSAGPGPFYVPDGGEWAGVRFRGEDASVGLGAGTLSVSVDPAGHVQGTLEGPLGPLRVAGELAGGELSAALVSSDPARGFSGTAVGKGDGDHLAGTMHLSLPTGNVIREATFHLERKP
jgi:hypothetical protein